MSRCRTILNLLILILLSYSSLASADISADPIGLEVGSNPYAYVEESIKITLIVQDKHLKAGRLADHAKVVVLAIWAVTMEAHPKCPTTSTYYQFQQGVCPIQHKAARKMCEGPASRPSEVAQGGRSLWDESGGEWRYYPGTNNTIRIGITTLTRLRALHGPISL